MKWGDDMGYVALRRLRWGDGWIEPGEAVPEGERGRNYAHLLRLGMIERVEGEDPEAASNPRQPEASESKDDGGDEGVSCPVCGITVASKFALAGHMRSHKSGD